MNPKEVKASVSLTAAHWRPGQAVWQLKYDNRPSKLLGENAFSSRQTTTFLIWSAALLPLKSNHGFKNRLLDHQGVKGYVKLEARVITTVSVKLNAISEGQVHSQELLWGLPEVKEDKLYTTFPSTLLPLSTRDSQEAEGSQEPFPEWGWSLSWRHAQCPNAPPSLLLCQAKIHSGTISSCSHDVLLALKFTAWLKLVL